MKKLFPTILIASMASPAFAVCPTASNLATGIEFTFEDGGVGVYRQTAPNHVLFSFGYHGRTSRTEALVRGVFPIELTEYDRGEPSYSYQTTYPARTKRLEMPAPNQSWEVNVTVHDGSDTYPERHVYAWSAIQTASYNDCQFDMMIGTREVYEGDDQSYVEEVRYFPNLEISAVTSFLIEGNGPAARNDIVRIRALD